MFKAAVGHSDDVDDADAAREALEACVGELGGVTPGAALVFAGSAKDPSVLLAEIAKRHPGLPVIGATSMAELSSSQPHAESSYAVMMLASDDVSMATGVGTNAARDPHAAARVAVDMARGRLRGEPRLCIAISDTLRVNVSRALEGVTLALGGSVPVLGGASACEITATLDPREMCDGEVFRDSIVVLLLGGPLRFAFGLDCGWKPVGSTHVATKADENMLLEIDGRPALEIYKRYLGAPAKDGAMFVHHPLAVYERPDGAFYLRASFAEGSVPGSLLTAGNIPQGATVRITEYQREQVVDAATASIASAKQRWGTGDPAAALVFTCSTRKTVLGTWTHREVDALRASLPPSTPIAGFYAFSELAPFEVGQPSRVHNGSFVTLLLGDA